MKPAAHSSQARGGPARGDRTPPSVSSRTYSFRVALGNRVIAKGRFGAARNSEREPDNVTHPGSRSMRQLIERLAGIVNLCGIPFSNPCRRVVSLLRALKALQKSERRRPVVVFVRALFSLFAHAASSNERIEACPEITNPKSEYQRLRV